MDDEPGEHAPLSLRYDTRPYVRDLQRALACSPTGAAIAVALTREAEGAGRDTSVSLNRNHYTTKPDGGLYTYARVRSAVEDLADAGLVTFWRQAQEVRGLQSVVRASPELTGIVRSVLDTGPPLSVLPPRDTVVLRRNGREERAPDTQAFNRQRRRIERWNRSLASAGLSIGDSSLTRIYVNDLKSCGRLFAEGGA